jgi:quinol monooxygenase YgiN
VTPVSTRSEDVDGVSVDPLIVTMVFDATDPGAFAAELSRYVVLSRNHEGCVNVDLAASATTPGRFVVISKWATPEAQRAHMDSPELVALAEASRTALAAPAAIDLLEPISAHDLR